MQNARSFLKIATYDGSGQATEPNVVSFDLPLHGFKYWMMFSPYPNGDESKENPSITVSNDGITWEVPPGLANPLELPSAGHLADASMFYDAKSDYLLVYYIRVTRARGDLEVFELISPDGVHWQNKGALFTVPTYEAVSPTVATVGSNYYMWTVNAGAAGCSATGSIVEYRTSSDGMKWSSSYATNMEQSGYVIWHLNVLYVAPKQEYWAAISAYPVGSDCSHTHLFFSNSRDGINWNSYSQPVLSPSNGWDNK